MHPGSSPGQAQNTRMTRRGSNAIGHAFDLVVWLAEIKQQAELQTGRFQIIGARRPAL